MTDAAPGTQEQKRRKDTVVAAVLSSDRVVLNKGEKDKIIVGQRFLIYEPSGEEIIDPITNESLGQLEIPKGTGRIVSVQDHLSVLESDTPRRDNPGSSLNVQGILDAFTPGAMAPFRNANVGDLVKRLG